MRLPIILGGPKFSRRAAQRMAVLAWLVGGCLAALLLAPPRGSSHEPITTKVMFNKEVVRIFQRSCLACHSAGTITQVQLATYDQARPWAKAIKEEVLEKRMPPYQAVKGYGRFAHDYLLPQREIDLIVSWVEGGAPKGEDKDLPRELKAGSGWALGPPDLILQPKPEVKISAEGEDEYRCFVLPTGLNEDRLVEAVDFRPGNGAVVHCASFFIDHTAPSRMLDAADRQAGDCQANGGGAADSFGEWVPGQAALRLPAGVARLLPAGSRIVVRVHYHKSGEAASDRSALGLYFAKARSARLLRTVAVTPPETIVPPGAESHRLKAAYMVPEDTEALAVRPLLYPFGRSVEATAYRPDGRAEVLIWARNYRYDWQPAYYFKKPVALPRGTRVEVTAYLDNSDNNPNNPGSPPRPVRFAEALCELLFIPAR